MTNIAWKNLAGERTRFAISVAGVAFSVVLVVILRGLYAGVIDSATRYVRTSGADLWVAQEGTPADFLQSRSILPLSDRSQLEAVSGVSRVSPLLSRPVGLRLKGRDADLFLLGIAPGNQVGWPEAVRNGRIVPGPGEVVIDRVFAKNNGVKAGDTLPIGAHGLRVAEVVTGGNAFAFQFAWANLSDVSALAGVDGFVSYFLVNTEGTDTAAVGRRIVEQVSGTPRGVEQGPRLGDPDTRAPHEQLVADGRAPAVAGVVVDLPVDLAVLDDQIEVLARRPQIGPRCSRGPSWRTATPTTCGRVSSRCCSCS